MRGVCLQVVEALVAELSEVDQHVFLLPAIQPYLLEPLDAHPTNRSYLYIIERNI